MSVRRSATSFGLAYSTMQKDSDGRMITTPPRLNGLRLRQHSFWSLMDPFVWNYVLDNGLDEVKEVEDLSSDDNESVVSSPEILVNSEVSAPSSVAGSIITPVKSVTPVDNHTSTMYPHLSQALGDENGYFYPADPAVKKSIRGLLNELNNLLSTKYKLNVQGISN